MLGEAEVLQRGHGNHHHERMVVQPMPVTPLEVVEALVAGLPYRTHTVLTNNGIQFRFAPCHADRSKARYMSHMFAMRCQQRGIENRFTRINNPWTNGQVERMHRTIKDATIKRFHYDNHVQLRQHLTDLVAAYNFSRRLKRPRRLTPYKFICKTWAAEPSCFKANLHHQMSGLST